MKKFLFFGKLFVLEKSFLKKSFFCFENFVFLFLDEEVFDPVDSSGGTVQDGSAHLWGDDGGVDWHCQDCSHCGGLHWGLGTYGDELPPCLAGRSASLVDVSSTVECWSDSPTSWPDEPAPLSGRLDSGDIDMPSVGEYLVFTFVT